MKVISCFLFGHADASYDLLPSLIAAIETHITEYGVGEFFFGYHGAFDELARHALMDVKKRWPCIRRTLVLPYHPAQQKTKLPEEIDGTYYPFEESVMPRYALVRANRAMIERCDYVIAYVSYAGKSRDFLEYAQRRSRLGVLQILNLGSL